MEGRGDSGTPDRRRPVTRYALISDIHANLPALEAVLDDIDARPDVTAIHHLGDLVGYAPWPDGSVALLRERRITGVAGNYDSTVALHYKHCGCRYEDAHQEALSHLSFEWTLEHTSTETKRHLAELPFRLDVRPLGGHMAGPGMILVHGTPTLNTVYWTEDRPDSFCTRMAEAAGARPGDLIAFGHTHRPWNRAVDGVHFANTGSVGRPRDGDPRAGYLLVEMSEAGVQVEVVRVAYAMERSARAIRESTLPDEFAEFLLTGGVPARVNGR